MTLQPLWLSHLKQRGGGQEGVVGELMDIIGHGEVAYVSLTPRSWPSMILYRLYAVLCTLYSKL